jgi:hypothetical protein
MVKRALGSGIDAQYFLADAWFATKSIFKLTAAQSLTAIVRMKKGKMKYRLTVNGVHQSINADICYTEIMLRGSGKNKRASLPVKIHHGRT